MLLLNKMCNNDAGPRDGDPQHLAQQHGGVLVQGLQGDLGPRDGRRQGHPRGTLTDTVPYRSGTIRPSSWILRRQGCGSAFICTKLQ